MTSSTTAAANMLALSDELLDKIVAELAHEGSNDDSALEHSQLLFLRDRLPAHFPDLAPLSLAHRRFTPLCQARLFAYLCFIQTRRKLLSKDQMQGRLLRLEALLERAPARAHAARVVCVDMRHTPFRPVWLFRDPTFLSIMTRLAHAAPRPNAAFVLRGFTFDDPVYTIAWLSSSNSKSFFGSSITSLVLSDCKYVPLSILRGLPNLKRLSMEELSLAIFDSGPPVVTTEDTDSTIRRDADAEMPVLDELDYRACGWVIRRLLEGEQLRPGAPQPQWLKPTAGRFSMTCHRRPYAN